MKIALLLWLMLFGLWPLADPGHDNFSDPLVWVDLMVHYGALAVFIGMAIEWRAESRAKEILRERRR